MPVGKWVFIIPLKFEDNFNFCSEWIQDQNKQNVSIKKCRNWLLGMLGVRLKNSKITYSIMVLIVA